MKINTIVSFFFIFFILGESSLLEANTAYAQLSSLTSQVPPLSGNAFIRLDSVDTALNIERSADKRHIIVKEPGTYFIMTTVQVGSIDQTSTGYVDIWLTRNRLKIANTGSRTTIDLPTSIQILISQAVLSLKADDTIGIGYSASGPSLGIVFLQPEMEPAITSVIFTIFKL